MLNEISRLFFCGVILLIVYPLPVTSCELTLFDEEIINTISLGDVSSELFLRRNGFNMVMSDIGLNLYLVESIGFRSRNVGTEAYFLSIKNGREWEYVVSSKVSPISLDDVVLRLERLSAAQLDYNSKCTFYNDTYSYMMHEYDRRYLYFSEDGNGPVVISNQNSNDLIILQYDNSKVVVERAFKALR